MTELLYRNAPLALAENDQWTIAGLAVPYGQIAKVGEYREQFAQGAFADAGEVPLFYGHGLSRGETPIGKLINVRDSKEGLHVEAKISKTAKGQEVYQLLKDGVLSKFSVGFAPVEQREVDGVTVRTKASLAELSIVARPAYDNAQITEIRNSSTSVEETQEKVATMPETNAADVLEVRNSIETLERRFDVLESREQGADSGALKFTSLGDFAKALVQGRASKEDAELLTRAYTGAQLSDSVNKNAWVARDIKFIEEKRPLFGLFNKEPLPPTGTTIEFPKVSTTVGNAGVQAAEGDDLTYLEVQLTTGTAAVTTLGGYSQLTRQVIERSTVDYINSVLKFQKIAYAKSSNLLTRTALTGATGTNTGTVAFADRGKAITWINALIQGVADIEANSYGLSAEVWVMTLPQFQVLSGIVDTTNRPVFDFNGSGVNTAGAIGAPGLRGNVAGVPVFVDPLLTGTYSYLVSKSAITTHESGPFNLADENIVNLSKTFSLYGYQAFEVADAKGIAKISHPLS